ncbi:MAG: L-seryl-tRNA(Sec) selenium transferase [Candidatus Eremiobacteraeota bacterium]|nr:L-seryl-tRNA(Sec) selenium transferase [Candidatus Eremiobacteraeota bacterium]
MPNAKSGIPAVQRFLSDERVAEYESALGRQNTKRAIDAELDRARRFQPIPPFSELLENVLERLEVARVQTLLETINATGILLHTNLGRAPLAADAIAASARISAGYSNLEFDLLSGRRGSRYARVSDAVREVTGAEDSLVVNNCAAAVLLVLDTFAKGREVIVSRNQLIEIGGGFRLPDVLERSGATLVEVGAVNKVYLRDYERALSPRTALLLRSHASNFRISGFTNDVDPAELAALGRRAGIPVAEDLGSGALVDVTEYGLPHERTVQDAVTDGIDLIAFSGDKLLGGPQAGIIVGRAPLVARLRSNPLVRALRVDKATIAALDATLRLYATRETRERIPFYRMLSASIDALRSRGRRFVDALPAGSLELLPSTAFIGGGSLPQTGLPSLALALRCGSPESISERLRRNDPAIIGRIADGQVLLDLRTIDPEQDLPLLTALRSIV